jgi:hypothetical protein
MPAVIQLHSPTTPPTRYGIVVSKISYVRPSPSGGTLVYLTPDSYLSVVEAYDDVVAAIEEAFGKRQSGQTPEQWKELWER